MLLDMFEWSETNEPDHFWGPDGLSREIMCNPSIPLPAESRKDVDEFKAILRRLNLLTVSTS
jgi:hypothetical protein